MARHRACVQPLADSNCFCGDTCIINNHFVIRLAVVGFPLLRLDGGQRHSCVSNHIYTLFPRDSSTMGEDPDDTSGGESTDERDEVVHQLWLIPSTSTSRIIHNLNRPGTLMKPRLVLRSRRLNPPTPPIPPTVPVSPITRPVSPATRFAILNSMWDENSVFFAPRLQGTYHQHRFASAVFEAATAGSDPHPPLRVRVRDVDEAADRFTELLDEAGRRGDYTDILVEDRAFGLLGREAAVGEGLQREVQYVVFQRFVLEQTSWFQQAAGGFSTLCTLYPSRCLSPLASPMLLSPAIFQYLIHDGNFNSLHPAFIGEWFPEIRLTMLDFLAVGPDADLTPFAPHLLTYLDMEPSAFQQRDLAGHLALAVMMLFKATLGNTSFDHPELLSFHAGFRLDCRNRCRWNLHGILNF
ncbi:hypothetical protein C8R44DRAFT_886222 [Mycena epipterygia]|nr:hypothetical protein C8R44DRAFT_886222 [Mycena epipterygia]